MPIKVFFSENGPFALVGTLEEAAALMKMGTAKTIELEMVGKTGLTESESVKEFWKDINQNAKNFLSYLLIRPEGVKGDKLTEDVGVAAEKFGGILGGVSKIASRYNLALSGILVSELRTEGTQRYRWLQPGPLLLKYKQEVLAGAKSGAKVTTMGA
jgi:hypothetical protein